MSDLSVINLTEKPPMMANNAQTDIYSHSQIAMAHARTYQQHREGDIYTPAVPRGYSVDTKGSGTNFQGIHGYISVMETLNFTF
jgi:hypothetical protein